MHKKINLWTFDESYKFNYNIVFLLHGENILNATYGQFWRSKYISEVEKMPFAFRRTWDVLLLS